MRLSALLAALFVAGCASTTTVTTQYRVAHSNAAGPLLLVADSPESALRKNWEKHCQSQFASQQLTVLLSHQEVAHWYRQGKPYILGWAQEQGIPRVLIVELTDLLIDLFPADEPHQLNPLDQPTDARPATWQKGLGGELTKQAEAEINRTHEATLYDEQGHTLWRAVTLTHEANSLNAIARSQCKALAKELKQNQLINE